MVIDADAHDKKTQNDVFRLKYNSKRMVLNKSWEGPWMDQCRAECGGDRRIQIVTVKLDEIKICAIFRTESE